MPAIETAQSSRRGSRTLLEEVPVWLGEDQALYLLRPHIRHAAEAPASEPGRMGWMDGAESEWLCDAGDVRFSARIEPDPFPGSRPACVLALSATALQRVQVGLCAVEFRSPCPTPPHCMDRFLRWRVLRGTVTLNDYAPLVVRWGAGAVQSEIRAFRGTVAGRLSWEREQFRLIVYLDAAALHPRWRFSAEGPISTAAPVWEPGRKIVVKLRLARAQDDAELPPAAASRFPAGAEACFTLTDHCDFDAPDRLAAFLYGDSRGNGWTGRGLRLTKCVFPLPSRPHNRPPAASLRNEEYRRLIERLRLDGSEIAPHAMNESGNLDPRTFRSALADFAAEWSPHTWVDHGRTLEYCYTMGGADHPEYRLAEALVRNGFRALWSFQDAPFDACASLNLLAPPRLSLGAIAASLGRHLARGRVLVALHYGRSALRWHARGRAGYVIGQALSRIRGLAMQWRRRGRISSRDLSQAVAFLARILWHSFRAGSHAGLEPYTRRELAEMAAVVYPEAAAPLHQAKLDDLLLFATSEVLHTRDAYTSRALDRLLRERGLHIGHSYLLNTLPYVAGIFEKGHERPRLTREWSAFVGGLEERVAAGRLWNPTLGDLADWMLAMQHVACVPAGNAALAVENPLSRPLAGFTVLLPRGILPESVTWSGAAPAGWRHWDDRLAVWGELPANSRTIVRWEREQ